MEQQQKDEFLEQDRDVAELVEIVVSIVEPYANELDEYLECVNNALVHEDALTNNELGEMILNIPTMIYFLGVGSEKIGLQEDYAKMKRGSVYNRAVKKATGTAGEKKAAAEIESEAQMLVSIVFNRAYKLIRHKADAAQEMLNSLKKVLSVRIAEAELSNNRFTGKRGDD